MSGRPELTASLSEGETLLWQGHPRPGRQVSFRANLLGVMFYAATIALALFAWWLEIYWGHVPLWRLAVYFVVAVSAFSFYLGLRVTLLDRRRARARDARTAYAITDRRALVVAGPYKADIALDPGVSAEVRGDTLLIEGEAAKLRFERLDDAAKARDTLLARIGSDA